MARQEKHTDDERAATLALLASNGGNIAKTARGTGLSESTIRNWRDGVGVAPPELVANKKADLAAMFKAEAEGALGAAKSKRDDANYRDLVTGAAIAADKYQLLSGEATERVEVSSLSDDEAITAARRLRLLEGGKAKRPA